MNNALNKTCQCCDKKFSKRYNISLMIWNKPTKFCSKKCHYKIGHSEETIKKIKEARAKQPDPRLGKKHSEKSKKKMSDSHKKSFIKDPTLSLRLSLAAKGQRRSTPTEFKKGLIPWNKDKNNPYSAGENNYNWKGGVTKLQEKIRKSLRYRQWRSDVFQRDTYTCLECGKRNGKGNGETILNADHIKPFSLILSENLIDTYDKALICEELWNINNGRTLCLDCHKKTPTYLKKLPLSSIFGLK